jgi:diaminopimelate decarboxylase
MLNTFTEEKQSKQKVNNPLWWERDDLHYLDDDLQFCGQNVSNFTLSHQTPTFVYSSKRVSSNLLKLNNALRSTGLSHKLLYAMKANPHPQILTHMKETGLCAIDACSPQELLQALECGFQASEISYTALVGDTREMDLLASFPDVLINCDSLTAIEHIGKRCPGRSIGIRVNPSIGIGYHNNELLAYSGEKTTKFGIYREQFHDALNLAKKLKLHVEYIHFHTGCGYLTPQLNVVDEIFSACTWFLDQVKNLKGVNIGGGLGVPHQEGDKPLDLKLWSELIHKHLSPYSVDVFLEPGEYILKDAGLLLLEVTFVEVKKETKFVGLNGGFNLAMEPAFYNLPLEPVHASLKRNSSPQVVTIVGNINESLDIWKENILWPLPKPGDIIAILNAGAYAASMSSNHCLRGQFAEILI